MNAAGDPQPIEQGRGTGTAPHHRSDAVEVRAEPTAADQESAFTDATPLFCGGTAAYPIATYLPLDATDVDGAGGRRHHTRRTAHRPGRRARRPAAAPRRAPSPAATAERPHRHQED